MPLFNIVGVSNTHRTFEVGLGFLSQELQEDYEWCLQCLQSIASKQQIRSPYCVITDCEIALMNGLESISFFKTARNILCIWHINSKNIAGKCKSGLTEEQWTELIQSINFVGIPHRRGLPDELAAFQRPQAYIN